MQTKNCHTCGEPYSQTVGDAQWQRSKYCSRECFRNRKSFGGPALTKACEVCGVIYERTTKLTYAQWDKSCVCSKACAVRLPKPSGINHHNFKGGVISLKCQECDCQFQVDYDTAKRRKFCSMVCKIKAQDNGISTENEKVRRSVAYREWRKAVFERDDYTCQECGQRGGELNADHIKPFAYFPELRFDVDNGRTLCIDCHRKTPTYSNRAKKQYESVGA